MGLPKLTSKRITVGRYMDGRCTLYDAKMGDGGIAYYSGTASNKWLAPMETVLNLLANPQAHEDGALIEWFEFDVDEVRAILRGGK